MVSQSEDESLRKDFVIDCSNRFNYSIRGNFDLISYEITGKNRTQSEVILMSSTTLSLDDAECF